jgi:hypothetical protein
MYGTVLHGHFIGLAHEQARQYRVPVADEYHLGMIEMGCLSMRESRIREAVMTC